MACSGIAEHNEARRRQHRKDMRAYQFMLMREEAERGPQPEKLIQKSCDSYGDEVQHLRKLGSPPGMSQSGHDPSSIDRRRREGVLRQQSEEYSAKLDKRFSSTDYISQW